MINKETLPLRRTIFHESRWWRLKQNRADGSGGFGLTEVVVSSLILMIVLTVVLRSQLDSAKRSEQSAELNQIQDKIRQDLNLLRQEALGWQCEPGTACTGKAADLDTPMRYDTSHCSSDEPLADFPAKSSILMDSGNIKIERRIDIINRQLDITYIGTSRGKTITNNASLVPQAMYWCS